MGVTLIIIKRNREYTPLFSVLMPGGLATLDIIIVIVIVIREHKIRVFGRSFLKCVERTYLDMSNRKVTDFW